MIIVGFSTSKQWVTIPGLIRKLTKKPFSHSYIRFKSQSWGVDFIYQNIASHTVFMGGERFQSLNNVIEEYEVECDKDTEKKIGILCVQREGKPYGFFQIFGKLLVILFRLKKNPFSDGDKTTDCIEEVYRILKKALNKEESIDMDSVDLNPYYDFIKSIGKKTCNQQVL